MQVEVGDDEPVEDRCSVGVEHAAAGAEVQPLGEERRPEPADVTVVVEITVRIDGALIVSDRDRLAKLADDF